MKLPKSFIKAEEKRLKIYDDLKVPLNKDPKWVQDIETVPPQPDFGIEREELEM